MAYVWRGKAYLHHKNQMIGPGDAIPDDLPEATFDRYLANGKIREELPATTSLLGKLQKAADAACKKAEQTKVTADKAATTAAKSGATKAQKKRVKETREKADEAAAAAGQALQALANAKETAESGADQE